MTDGASPPSASSIVGPEPSPRLTGQGPDEGALYSSAITPGNCAKQIDLAVSMKSCANGASA